MRSARLLLSLLTLSWVLSSCASSSWAGMGWGRSWFQGWGSSSEVSAEQQVTSLLSEYSEDYRLRMGAPIAQAGTVITHTYPESSLGNLIADAMRFRATRHMREFIHASVLEDGSIFMFLDEGVITRGDLIEMLPYESELIVVKLNGDKILQLAEEMAAREIKVMSGMRLTKSPNGLQSVLIDRSTADPDQTYWVATSDWLANGNGPFPALWDASERVETGLFIRDVVEEAISLQRMVSPVLDQRVMIRR